MTNREWQQRRYWSDPDYRERRLARARDWRWRNPDKVYAYATRRYDEQVIARLTERLVAQ
jgi:hypothetical protein